MKVTIMHVQQHHNSSAAARLHGVQETTLHDRLPGRSEDKMPHVLIPGSGREQINVQTCVSFRPNPPTICGL